MRPAAAEPSPPPAPPRPTATPTAAELGLHAYDEDAESPFPAGWAEATPLAADEIAPTFDNLDDLAWLTPVARSKKLVLFGESHYFLATHRLAHRVLFALQRGDHFHLLTMETQYSETPYLDHYVQLADDAEAERFYRDELAPMVDTEDLRVLLERVRTWNHLHPTRRIHLAGHDIEHDFATTIRRVLAPYFHRLAPALTLDANDYIADPEAFLARLDALVGRARKARLVGAYPFLTADFIATVVENLRSLQRAQSLDHTYYRQRAIVRNLTDPRYLGRWLRTGKVMLWGGSYHTVTRRVFPDGGAFLREGIYLAHEFAPTRGQTFSIDVLGLAYSLDDMADVDATSLGHMGDGYRDALGALQRAYRAGAIGRDDAYFTQAPPQTITAALALARTVDHRPYRLTVAWGVLGLVLPHLPSDIQSQVRAARTELDGHDAFFVVPRSPLVRHLAR